MSQEKTWFLYIIRCKGGVLYTGISTDVERRFKAHQAGKGAKFLRGKAPLALVYHMQIGNHSEALKAELNIKKLCKAEKEKLILAGESSLQS